MQTRKIAIAALVIALACLLFSVMAWRNSVRGVAAVNDLKNRIEFAGMEIDQNTQILAKRHYRILDLEERVKKIEDSTSALSSLQ